MAGRAGGGAEAGAGIETGVEVGSEVGIESFECRKAERTVAPKATARTRALVFALRWLGDLAPLLRVPRGTALAVGGCWLALG